MDSTNDDDYTSLEYLIEVLGYTKRQVLAAIIAAKVGSLLSLLGSSYILQDVFRSPQKRKSLYHRIILGVAGSDILHALAFFLGSWLMPKGEQLLAFSNEGMPFCGLCSSIWMVLITTLQLFSSNLLLPRVEMQPG